MEGSGLQVRMRRGVVSRWVMETGLLLAPPLLGSCLLNQVVFPPVSEALGKVSKRYQFSAYGHAYILGR